MSRISISLPKTIRKKAKFSVQEILEESSRTAKKGKVKLSDLLAVAEEVRQELFLERYSQ